MKRAKSIVIKKEKQSIRRRNMRFSMKRAVFLIAAVLFIVVFSLYKTAEAKESEPYTKYYKTITIQAEDSLWSIAEKYNENSGQSIQAEINEIRKINHLGSVYYLKSGMNLIVPYYAN